MLLLVLLINQFLMICDVRGKEKLARYVVEDNVKPAIFGSYSYNPLTQMFEKKDDPSGSGNIIQIQIFNRTITQPQITTEPPSMRNIFRKHVTAGKFKSQKPFHLRSNILRNRSHNSTGITNSQMSTDQDQFLPEQNI